MKKSNCQRVQEWIVPLGRGLKMTYRRYAGKRPSLLLR